jgi:adenylate cyclase
MRGFVKKNISLAIVLTISIISPILSSNSRIGTTIDNIFYDWLFKHAPQIRVKSADKSLAIVGIDDASIDEMRTPLVLWQGYFARVISSLAEAGAKGVVFDVIPTVSLETIAPQLDAALIGAIRNAREKGTMVFYGFKAGTVGGQMPHPKFGFVATGLGYTNLYPDQDSVVRHHFVWADDGKGYVVPSLPLVAYMSLSGIPRVDKEHVCEKWQLCGKGAMPVRLVIDYRIDQKAIPTYSFSALLHRADDKESMRRDFYGRVVMVGPLSDRIPDNHKTPVHWLSNDDTYMPGLRIQTQTVMSIMQKERFSEMESSGKILLALMVAAGATALSFVLRPAWAAMVMGSLTGVGAVAVAVAFSQNYLLPFSAIMYGVAIPGGTVKGYLYVRQHGNLKILKRYFGSYVNAEVMKEILRAPEKVNFDGSLVTATVMFTDIRNFTTISESLPPQAVMKGLNKYLEAMTKVVIAEGGYVNRYLGDGILALFGAPTPLPYDGALAAVKAGLAMERALAELNKEELFPGVSSIKIGVGIHTGRVIVGNVGCFEKMDYTVIGDAANLASRIEGLTKQYGVFMLISQDTNERIKDHFSASHVDNVTVKGRQGTTEILTVNNTINNEVKL